MTATPARRLGLRGRGVVAEGGFADRVALDPAAVADRATLEQPHQSAADIEAAFVNGEFAVERGRTNGRRAGRVLRRGAPDPPPPGRPSDPSHTHHAP